jgi:hypothetical protein
LPASTSSSPSLPSARPSSANSAPASSGARALGAVAQLEPVAEDHDPVDVPRRLEQRLAQLRASQQVAARSGAQVQVRDHERSHRH